MRTLDLIIEDTSFNELAAASAAAGVSPTEFIRRATVAAVRLYQARDARQRDIAGYERAPVSDAEFAVHPDDLKRAENEAW